MKEEVDNYELIDQYLSGALPQGHPFIAQVENDPDLAAEVELQRMVTRAVIDRRLSDVSKEIHAYRETKQIGQKSFKYYFITLLFLAFSIGALFFLTKNKSIKEKKSNTNDRSHNLSQNKLPSTPPVPLTISKENKQPKSTWVEPIQKKYTNSNSQHPAILPTRKDSSIDLSENKTTSYIAESYKKEAIPNTNSVDKTFIRPCDTVNIHAEFSKILPCEKSSNGSLNFEKANGGVGPYFYSIDGGKHFQQEKLFSNLPSADYDLYVKDRNNCIGVVQKGVTLVTKICLETESYIFDPTRETWNIPSDPQKSGKITIYNKNGQVVFYKNFGLTEELTWNGTSENGEVLKPGLYIYTIEHVNGLLKQGSVTLSY